MDTVAIPPGAPDGGTVRGTIGNFWSIIYNDKTFLSTYFSGSGAVAAQVYLEFMETQAALGRLTIPNFHRELWYPVLLRRSQRNRGSSIAIVCGQQPPLVLGPQPTDTAYQPGAVYEVGGAAPLYGMVAYPVDLAIDLRGSVTIAEDIVKPTTALLRNVDFYVTGHALMFTADADPFNEGSPFPLRTITDPVTGEYDTEALLWVSDVYVDKELVYNHFGYAVQHREASSELYRARVNALWDVRFRSSTTAALRSAIAGMLGLACTSPAPETVQVIDDRVVVTDKAVYRIGPNEVLLPTVSVGAVIPPTSWLTDSAKLYSSLATQAFEAANGFTVSDFIADIPALFLPAGIVGSDPSIQGFTVAWEDTPIVYHGDDSNGNPKLSFAVGTTADQQALYWSTVWQLAEQRGESLATTFADYLPAPPPYFLVDGEVGSINPLKFFMDNALRAAVSVLYLDFSRLPTYIGSLEVLAKLKPLIPAHAMLLVVGRQAVEDEHNLDDDTDAVTAAYGLTLTDTADQLLPVVDTLRYYDAPIMTRWIPK